MAAVAGWTGSCGVLWVLGAATLGFVPGWRHRWRRRMTCQWAAGVARILGMRIAVDGPEPEPPFLMVTNHLSYLDVILLSARLGCSFVAKSEVRTWPMLGGLARAAGTVFIDRANKRDVVRVMQRIEERLARGDGVVVFAEGTSTRGEGVNEMKPALLDYAARTGYPIQYASLSYRTPPGEAPAHLSVCWWGDMTFGRHFWALCQLEKIDASLSFGRDVIRGNDRKVLAEQVRAAVARRFTPVVAARSVSS